MDDLFEPVKAPKKKKKRKKLDPKVQAFIIVFGIIFLSFAVSATRFLIPQNIQDGKSLLAKAVKDFNFNDYYDLDGYVKIYDKTKDQSYEKSEVLKYKGDFVKLDVPNFNSEDLNISLNTKNDFQNKKAMTNFKLDYKNNNILDLDFLDAGTFWGIYSKAFFNEMLAVKKENIQDFFKKLDNGKDQYLKQAQLLKEDFKKVSAFQSQDMSLAKYLYYEENMNIVKKTLEEYVQKIPSENIQGKTNVKTKYNKKEYKVDNISVELSKKQVGEFLTLLNTNLSKNKYGQELVKSNMQNIFNLESTKANTNTTTQNAIATSQNTAVVQQSQPVQTQVQQNQNQSAQTLPVQTQEIPNGDIRKPEQNNNAQNNNGQNVQNTQNSQNANNGNVSKNNTNNQNANNASVNTQDKYATINVYIIAKDKLKIDVHIDGKTYSFECSKEKDKGQIIGILNGKHQIAITKNISSGTVYSQFEYGLTETEKEKLNSQNSSLIRVDPIQGQQGQIANTQRSQDLLASTQNVQNAQRNQNQNMQNAQFKKEVTFEDTIFKLLFLDSITKDDFKNPSLEKLGFYQKRSQNLATANISYSFKSQIANKGQNPMIVEDENTINYHNNVQIPMDKKVMFLDTQDAASLDKIFKDVVFPQIEKVVIQKLYVIKNLSSAR